MHLKQFLIRNSLKWVIIVSLVTAARANPDAKRLYDDLLSNYNRLIRPVSNNTDTVLVKLGLRLSQLIDLVSESVTILHECQQYRSTSPKSISPERFQQNITLRRFIIVRVDNDAPSRCSTTALEKFLIEQSFIDLICERISFPFDEER